MNENPSNKLGTPDEDGDLNPRFSPERKIEVSGFLLILLGILVFLSVISNTESDYTQVSGFGFVDIITTDSNMIPIVKNWLGIFGAILSHHLIYNFLGYPVILIAVIIILWGWVMMRHHGLAKPTYLSLYGLVFNLLFSTFFGLVAVISESELSNNAWSGLIGVFLASVLHSVLGSVGSVLIVFGLLFAVFVLFINLNLKKSASATQSFVQLLLGKMSVGLSEKFESLTDSVKEKLKSTDREPAEIPSQPKTVIGDEKINQPGETDSDLLSMFKEDEKSEGMTDQPNIKSSEQKSPKEAETRSGILSTKNIGIPIDEIFPPERETAAVDQLTDQTETETAPSSAEPVSDLSQLKSIEEELIPVLVPASAENSLTIPEPEDVTTGELSNQTKRSDNLAEYLKSKIKPSAQETDNTSQEINKEELDVQETESMPIDRVTPMPEENFVTPVTETAAIPEIPIVINQTVSAEPEIETAPVNSTAFTEDVQPEPAEPEIKLEIKVFDEQKAAIVRDPILKFGYNKPTVSLLRENKKSVHDVINHEELEENKQKLISKLKTYGIEIEGKMEATIGPKVTLYEFKPAEGIKVSRITGLADDIALAMAAKGIRIMAPVPGKAFVGVEIPNRESVDVLLREVLESEKFREASQGRKSADGSWEKEPMLLPIALGRTIENAIYIEDLAKLPHLLVAGTTGSGKSVGINTIICSLLFHAHPQQLKFVMIDPKRVELSIYKRLERHFLAVLPELNEPIITDTGKAITLLRAVEKEMDQRYDLLSRVGVRNLKDFNKKVENGDIKQPDNDPYVKLPFIVVIIDELADLMMTAGKEVEEPIARIAQLARAVGIHLVVATQRPSVDVITGLIKANFPARIAYQVMSKIDSRTILDMNGADQLLGYGDMLYLPNGSPKPVRIQNAFVSTDECDAIIDHIAKQPGFLTAYRLPAPAEKNPKGGPGSKSDASENNEWDELLVEAAHIVVQHEQGSTSLLQRRLRIGYSRAARIIDQLDILGIVGPPDGSKARQVTVQDESMLKDILDTM